MKFSLVSNGSRKGYNQSAPYTMPVSCASFTGHEISENCIVQSQVILTHIRCDKHILRQLVIIEVNIELVKAFDGVESGCIVIVQNGGAII